MTTMNWFIAPTPSSTHLDGCLGCCQPLEISNTKISHHFPSFLVPSWVGFLGWTPGGGYGVCRYLTSYVVPTQEMMYTPMTVRPVLSDAWSWLWGLASWWASATQGLFGLRFGWQCGQQPFCVAIGGSTSVTCPFVPLPLSPSGCWAFFRVDLLELLP